jgi:crotonobetainyl-CoA:carnitine CoA-transferase CaiB-like acyl-CoA transferase
MEALHGLKVVEYGNMVSAPYCARLLAGLGAEVIKVENPVTGDEARQHGPFPDGMPAPEKSGLFLSLNMNKLGITLNLDTMTGKKIFKRLIEDADIFVENNAPEVVKKLGMSYEELININPKLIMVSITPFGHTGPYRDYKAYDINCCAADGVSVGIGEPEREPLPLPLSQGSYQAGASAAVAALTALLARRKTGEGQYIDISEVEVMATLHMAQNILTFLYRGVTGIRRGIHGGFFLYPGSVLPCKDGYINLVAPQLDQWTRFLNMIGNPSWKDDPRYQNRRAMHEHYPDEADALLKPWLKEYTKEEVFQKSQENRVPLSPVYDIGDLVDHPHLKERHFFTEIDHPEAGTLKYPLGPSKFSETDWNIRRAAPLLGQDNEEILCRRLGYSKEEFNILKHTGVI